MYKLIADSGATKTDWCAAFPDNTLHYFRSKGMNPHLLEKEDLIRILNAEVLPELPDKNMAEIYFFGSGCAAPEKKQLIIESMMERIPAASMHISTDLEGAGIALFGKEDGIACILGTGSGAAIVSAGKVIRQAKSQSFPEGDVGGGAYLVKELIRETLKGNADEKIRLALDHLIEGDIENYSDRIRSNEINRTEVAAIYKKLAPLYDNPIMHNITERSFRLFIKDIKGQFKDSWDSVEWGFIGSIALLNQHEIEKIAGEEHIKLKEVIASPIERIQKYILQEYD